MSKLEASPIRTLGHLRSADFPVCGLWGLSSPHAELESSANPQTGKSALRHNRPKLAGLFMRQGLEEDGATGQAVVDLLDSSRRRQLGQAKPDRSRGFLQAV